MQALSIVEIAVDNAAFAASLSFATTAASTFLIAVLTSDLIDLFLAVLISVTKILFFADLMLASLVHLQCVIVIVHDCYIKAGHGQFNVNIP